MLYLVDTNVLVRLNEPSSPLYLVAQNALAVLRTRGETLCLSRQNLIEFRNAATRPAARNGLGLTAQEADAELTLMEQYYTILPDVDAIYQTWRALVSGLGVMGKQVHDTRLVAAMLVYGVTHLLTFNVQDFVRFGALPAGLGPGITVVAPLSV